MTLDVEWEYAAKLCREAYDAGHSVLILGTVGSGKSTVKQMVTEKLPQAATFQVVHGAGAGKSGTGRSPRRNSRGAGRKHLR